MNEPVQTPDQKAARLMSVLRGAAADRGAMADLRCAWSETRRSRAWPWLGRAGLIGDLVAETVAGAFGYHPEECRKGNFGTACRQMAREHAGAAHRFARLLRASRLEVCLMIRPLILALRSTGTPVNHERLASDLWYWSDAVRERWAREFWTAEFGLLEQEAAPEPASEGTAE